MLLFITWKLEWTKILFKLTSKREVVICTVKYNCFDSFFQILFVNITVWILLWILMLLSALNISVNITHLEILRQSRLKWEIEINWRGHKIFLEKVTWPWIFSSIVLWALKYFLKNFEKPSSPSSYILNVHSLIMNVSSEVAVCRCSSKEMFLKISQYSQ